MILAYLKIILAIFLVWPRGYVLIYLIDRSKSMSFGFKFFGGWLLGLAGFTLDLFATNVFSGLSFGPLLFIASSITQIFGFSLMIFLFERRIPWPNPKKLKPFLIRQFNGFLVWPAWQKIALGLLILSVLIRAAASFWQITNIPTYDFDAWNNWNLRAKVIYTEKTIPLAAGDTFRLGGGISSYPLNDSLFKVWLAAAAGGFEDRYINLASLFYYLILLAVFYFSLPPQINRGLKLLAAYLLSSLPLVYFHSQVPYADLLFSIFLFLSVASLFYYLAGRGNSFYYFSGIALAFSIWTKNEGLSIILPLMIITTVTLLILKKVQLKHFLLSWFFAALTIAPWLFFRTINNLYFLSGDSSTFNLVFNSQFIVEIISSIFLRSHFNFLWLLVFMVMILNFKGIWSEFSRRYLLITLAALFLFYNVVILFTDKALDLSALARINLQLAPLGVLFLTFFFQDFFAKIKGS